MFFSFTVRNKKKKNQIQRYSEQVQRFSAQIIIGNDSAEFGLQVEETSSAQTSKETTKHFHFFFSLKLDVEEI